MASSIKLVLFDIGRVLMRLVDSMDHACRRAGVAAPKNIDQAALVDVSHAHERGEIDNATFLKRAAQIMNLRPQQVLAISQNWICGQFDQTNGMIEVLHEKKIDMACFSNTNAIHWEMMHGDGPNGLPFEKFRYAFASHLIGIMKPDHGIYRHIETHTGLAGPEMVFFDDAPQNVQVARARGWHAHQITPDEPPYTQVVEHLVEMGIV